MKKKLLPEQSIIQSIYIYLLTLTIKIISIINNGKFINYSIHTYIWKKY